MRLAHRRMIGMLRIKVVIERVVSLLRTPVFWLLSIGGNAFVALGALVMNLLERDLNPGAVQFLDCLSWAVGIVTTVGGGTLVPVTAGGKILGILMMIVGAVFLWSYMALFIGALVCPELRLIEREVDEIQKATHRDEDVLAKIREIISHSDQQKKSQ